MCVLYCGMNISTLIERLEAIRLHYGDNFKVKMRIDDDTQRGIHKIFGEEFGGFDVEVRNDGVILVAEITPKFW